MDVRLTAGKMKTYLENPRVLGLGEVMDAPSVISGAVSMHEKLRLYFRIKYGMVMLRFFQEGIWQLMRWRVYAQTTSV